MQYSWNLTLSDGERILIENLLDNYINKCQEKNIPIGLFAEKLYEKLTHNLRQSIPTV